MASAMYESGAPIETVKYILGEYLMHAWLDFVQKLQKYTSFAHNWSTNEECMQKLDDAVLVLYVPNHQLLAKNADIVAYLSDGRI